MFRVPAQPRTSCEHGRCAGQSSGCPRDPSTTGDTPATTVPRAQEPDTRGAPTRSASSSRRGFKQRLGLSPPPSGSCPVLSCVKPGAGPPRRPFPAREGTACPQWDQPRAARVWGLGSGVGTPGGTAGWAGPEQVQGGKGPPGSLHCPGAQERAVFLHLLFFQGKRFPDGRACVWVRVRLGAAPPSSPGVHAGHGHPGTAGCPGRRPTVARWPPAPAGPRWTPAQRLPGLHPPAERPGAPRHPLGLASSTGLQVLPSP